MADLTERERELMRHALGLTRAAESYRNYFAAHEGSVDTPTWRGLVARGLATERRFAMGGDGGLLFHVTEDGKAAVMADRPAQQRNIDAGRG